MTPKTTEEVNVLMQMIHSHEAAEWKKWEDEDLLGDSIVLTLCDVRREVEKVFGVKSFSTLQILEAIRDARGRVTHRLESETVDLCLVNLSRVMDILSHH